MPAIDVETSIFPTGLTEAENRLVGDVEAWLREAGSNDCGLVRERFFHLCSLGAAVFAYPSIRHTQFLKGIIRDEGHLADSLLGFSSPSQLLHIPTKVVAMRSFLVAKFHAFSLLSYLTPDKDDLHARIRAVIFSIISTLMTEVVYFTCLEDPDFSHNTKASLAEDLISLWDSGVDLRGIRHLSALSSLWLARKSVPPSFGTMNGTVELLRITIDLEEDWREFLVTEAGNDETKWALEEFLFGLSWEEIQKVRSRLASFGVSAVGYDEIRSYLDSKPTFTIEDASDPRMFYDFFIKRKDSCSLRKRVCAPGPRHTLEEIYLKYRIIMEHS
ncbi:MAG: hypothetical protein LBQ69_00635 [Treponema sp.]|jgi:hypothetical protein|nr:hypothetical protein [Treponema sp.]